MTTAFDAVDDYERLLARRSARAKVMGAIAVAVLVAGLLGWKVFKLVARVDHLTRARPVAAVVHVRDDGTLSVESCTKSVAACLEDARAGGAGTCEANINPAASAEANQEAIRTCMSSGMNFQIVQSAR